LKVDKPGDLIFQTYFMVDWNRTEQSATNEKCVQCGGDLRKVEGVTDKNGRRYEGRVCHSCKLVIWMKSD
jgi:uncharacterized protein with PIN domain